MITKLIFFLSLYLLISIPIHAQTQNKNSDSAAGAQALTIIESCRAKSKEKWDTGVTSEMMNGSYEYATCLTQNIEKISQFYFTDSKNKAEKEQFQAALMAYTEKSYELYHMIYNGPCDPCGTLVRPFHISATAESLENILITMLENAYEHHRPIDKALSEP